MACRIVVKQKKRDPSRTPLSSASTFLVATKTQLSAQRGERVRERTVVKGIVFEIGVGEFLLFC